VCVCAHVCAYVRVRVHACVHACACVFVRMCVCFCMRVRGFVLYLYARRFTIRNLRRKHFKVGFAVAELILQLQRQIRGTVEESWFMVYSFGFIIHHTWCQYALGLRFRLYCLLLLRELMHSQRQI